MQIFKRTLTAAMLALIGTVIASATTVIVLMFTDGREMGHHVGLFNSLFFEAYETDTGSIMVGIGIENPWGLTMIFLVIFAVLMIFLTILSALKQRKACLEQNLPSGPK